MSENNQPYELPEHQTMTYEDKQRSIINELKVFIGEQEEFSTQLEKDWGNTKISSMDLHTLLTARITQTEKRYSEVCSHIATIKEHILKFNERVLEELSVLDSYKGVLEGLSNRFKEDTAIEGVEVETIKFLNGFREMIEKNTTSSSAVLANMYRVEVDKRFSVEQLVSFIAMSSNLKKQKENFDRLLHQTLKEREI